MKKVIEGTTYDTKTANHICTASFNEFSGHKLGPTRYARLYEKTNGEFFFYTYQEDWSGPKSPKIIEKAIEPLFVEEAYSFVKKHHPDLIEEVFGPADE